MVVAQGRVWVCVVIGGIAQRGSPLYVDTDGSLTMTQLSADHAEACCIWSSGQLSHSRPQSVDSGSHCFVGAFNSVGGLESVRGAFWVAGLFHRSELSVWARLTSSVDVLMVCGESRMTCE